jgi:formylglycine-generating enzyme required for sulfatase activity
MALLALAWVVICLAGCGSTEQQQPEVAHETGSFGVTVRWPARPEGVGTELIPLASNSITVEIIPDDLEQAPRTVTINRPETHAIADGVPAGDALLRAGAYPLADGQGVAQASAELGVTVLANEYNEWPLILQSTIASVRISPNPSSVAVGDTLTLTATAMNADGETVLVPATGGFTWGITEGAAASIEEGGVVTGLADGTAVVRATETASAEGERKSGIGVVGVCGRCAPGEEMTGADGQTLVWVPTGGFMMGSDEGAPDEQPVHQVALDGFWIGQCEVTNAQYRAFCDATGRPFPGDSNEDDEQPIRYVSWDDAQAYCGHYGYMLPTEAQWEYAARGPTVPEYPWGDVWDTQKCCNYGNTGPGGGPLPVGSFPAGASWCGALDMAGNVWEWCADLYDENYYQASPRVNPPGPDSGGYQVLRGGSCFNSDAQYYCRAATRGVHFASTADRTFGFRVTTAAGRP